MKTALTLLLASLFAAQASAQAPATKSPSGQVYRCGNQYLDRPCNEKGGKAVQLANNVSVPAARSGDTPPHLKKRPPQCNEMEKQADVMQRDSRGKSSNQGLADLRGQIESSGC